ncbi:hypothetical protein MJG53_008079 [Ovis ammon polii x Ovis aries]|uniref:Uncharacterized protein n=1 Tax=Ovis ammon polii x Ovis aries TaxID=2918886 RepID=A0ACB9UZH0_9CETA|nr:hypothetical protein MJG53_008079 [Ovis ammon polii x Ovis aries]
MLAGSQALEHPVLGLGALPSRDIRGLDPEGTERMDGQSDHPLQSAPSCRQSVGPIGGLKCLERITPSGLASQTAAPGFSVVTGFDFLFDSEATDEDEKLQGKINDEDKQEILDICNEIINWLNKNQTAEKEVFEHQEKELEKVCNPIGPGCLSSMAAYIIREGKLWRGTGLGYFRISQPPMKDTIRTILQLKMMERSQSDWSIDSGCGRGL